MTPQLPPASALRVLITRPEPGASELAAALGSGIVSPLIRIETRPVAVPEGTRALVLTSANGARALGPWRAGPRLAWCVGARTAEAAQALGYEAVSADGDAGALADRLAAEAEGPLLHVRGAHARGGIAGRLSAAGIPCAEAIAYDQPFVPLTDAARAALAGTAPLVVPLYSPRTAARLAEIAPRPRAPLRLVAMSPAVAEAAAPLGRAGIADRPDADAMLAAIHRRLADDPAGLDGPGRHEAEQRRGDPPA